MSRLTPLARAPKVSRRHQFVPGVAGAIAAIALAATALPALAQPVPGDAPGQPPREGHGHHGMPFPGPIARITVSGDGTGYVAPDMAQIMVGVSTQALTAEQAMADNAKQQQAVLDKLKAEGIAEKDIQTSGLNLSPVQDYSNDGKPPKITGYAAQNMVTIQVRDLTKLGETLDQVVSVGANEISSISFSREDATEAEDQAREKAIEKARHRAEVMAKASGMKLGPLMALSDSEMAQSPMPMMARDMAKAASTPVSPGELAISATVSATYALLPEGDAGAPTPQAPEAPAN